jgi:hypothetical protein
LEEANLFQAKILMGATMPDGSRFEQWILRLQELEIDPIARAEIDRLKVARLLTLEFDDEE